MTVAAAAIRFVICLSPRLNTESDSAGPANSRKRSKSAIAIAVIATTAPAPVGSVFDRRNPASETTETIAIVFAAFSWLRCKSRWARMTATASLVRPRACLTVLVSAACWAKPCIAVLTIGAAQGLSSRRADGLRRSRRKPCARSKRSRRRQSGRPGTKRHVRIPPARPDGRDRSPSPSRKSKPFDRLGGFPAPYLRRARRQTGRASCPATAVGRRSRMSACSRRLSVRVRLLVRRIIGILPLRMV